MKSNLFRKLTLRTIKANIRQFLSVILIVLLSTMLLSGFITNSSTLDSSINKYFEETNLADLWLFTDGVNVSDEQFLIDNKISFNKRLYLETSAKIEEKKIQNTTKIYVLDSKSILNNGSAISEPYLEAGLAGCLIDKNVAKDRGIEIGFDEIEFSYTLSTEIAGQQVEVPINMKFIITGTMSLDECADTYSSWPVFIDDELFLDAYHSAIISAADELGMHLTSSMASEMFTLPVNQILIKTNSVSETKDLIENYYKTSDSNLFYIFDRNQIESVVLLNAEIEQSRKMIYVFPIIFVIVSILIILTTIDQLVIQERTRIGTLKSIGIPDKRVLYQYSRYGAVLCLIGSVIGIILGVIIIPNIMFIKYNLVYSLPSDFIKLNIPFVWLIVVLVTMVMMGFIVALSACFKILHKKPVECLKQDIGNTAKIKGKIRKNSKKLPLSIRMAARNLKLKPVRAVMVTIGIAGCMALLLCGFGIGNTLTHSINSDLGNTFKYDISSTYLESNRDKFFAELNENKNIEFYEEVDIFYVETMNGKNVKNISLYKIQEQSKLTDIKISSGEAWISKAIADNLKANIGSIISVSSGGKTTSVKVTNIIETSIINGVFVADDLGFNTELASHGVWIKSNDISKEMLDKLNSLNGTDGASSMQQLKDSAFSKVSSIDLMTTTLETFAILLAVIVLFNLIFLIIKERVRELATLKVIGVGLFNILLTIFFEVLFMAIFGSILGMILGYPLLMLVLFINKVEIVNYLYYLSPLSYIWALLIIFLTIVVVTALCIVRVRRINMIESLKSVE